MARYQTCEGCGATVPERDLETVDGQRLCSQCRVQVIGV